MKILHVTSGLSPTGAGVREVVMSLSGSQLANGSSVQVLGLESKDWPNDQELWDGAPAEALRIVGPRSFGYAPSMTSSIMENEPDIVHLHGLWMHPGRSVLQWHRSTNRPYIISTHGMLADAALSYSRWKKKIAYTLFQRAVLRSAAAIHVTSSAEAQDVHRFGISAPIHVVPNGIERMDQPSGALKPGRTILSVGRIHEIKGFDQLILGWGGIANDFPEWSLKIHGPDQNGEAARLEAMIKANGIERVSIEGPIYGSKKIKEMSSAGVFVLSSRSENFGLTAAESLMVGVPVVATHGTPWQKLDQKKCGAWVPYGAEAMSGALGSILALSDADRRAMGQRGRDWMLQEFSWHRISARLSEVYSEVIESRL